FVTTTVRLAVSPGTRLVMLMRSLAFGLSLLIERVADPNVLLGFVLVAVKFAEVLSAVAVRPSRTSPASAMPARRLSLRIQVVPFSFRSAGSLSCSWSGGSCLRGSGSALPERAPSAFRGRKGPSLVVVPGRRTARDHPLVSRASSRRSRPRAGKAPQPCWRLFARRSPKADPPPAQRFSISMRRLLQPRARHQNAVAAVRATKQA